MSLNSPEHNRESRAPEAPAASLRFLYNTIPGRLVLRTVRRPFVSRAAGRYMDSCLSRRRIARFVQKNGINLCEYEEREYRSFNDFFTRRLKPDARSVDTAPEALIAPCDSKLTVYKITSESVFHIKNSDYSIASLLGDETLARQFAGGVCLVFRLCVDDYHRYCWFDSGVAGESAAIRGELNTVQPIAFEGGRHVFLRNSREYTVLESDSFGRTVQMEVGALMVGRIVNNAPAGRISRGDEKGRFEFGGSTCILLLGGNRANIDADILNNSVAGLETVVRYGERIGVASGE